MTTHPIEAESMRLVAERVDLSGHEPGVRAVIARVIHASADPEYAATLAVNPSAVRAGADALRAGAPVVTDVEMVRHGLRGVGARCYLSEVAAGAEPGLTRSAAAMGLAASRHPEGAVVVVGCAPTALVEVLRLVRAGRFSPALVIGLPVGFVGAAESKQALRDSGLSAISNVGEKGGSAVAAAAFNAVASIAGKA